MKNKLDFADIPDAFKDMRLKDMKLNIYDANNRQLVVDACNLVKTWLDNLDEMSKQGRGLYIYSKTKGSGKTRLATSLANELIYEYGKVVKFATSMQILNAIKSSWNGDERDGENSLLKDLSTVQYLFIDDFGTESVKDWIEEKFYHIINNRYVDRKVTIITSNYDIESLRYDDRIKDRITEKCYEIHFAEQSVRKIIAQINARDLLAKSKTNN